MSTTVSSEVLQELARLITESCEHGDTVIAIAERSGKNFQFISGLKNGTYTSIPSIEAVEAVCEAIGVSLALKRTKKLPPIPEKKHRKNRMKSDG